MKKALILLLIVTPLSRYSLGQETNYVITGQLYGTPRHGYPDRMNGKVYEVKYLAFWPKEENGQIVKGNRITGAERGNISLSQDFVEQYNQSGTIIRFESMNDFDEVTSYWKVEAEGKTIIKAENFNRTHLITGYNIYTYNEGNLREVKMSRNVNGPVLMRIVYEYDSLGNRIRFQTYNGLNIPGSYTEFTYNKTGMLNGFKSYSADGKMISTFEYKYNEKGEIISSHSENFLKGTTGDFILMHEYDKMGNWIKAVSFKDGKPFYVREREIKYYE